MTIPADDDVADCSQIETTTDFVGGASRHENRVDIAHYGRSLIFSAPLDLAFYPDICNIAIGDDENIVTYQSGDLGV